MKTLFAVILSIIAFPTTAKKLDDSFFNKENTTYVISVDYDLAGKTITIPAGCILQYNGGVIKNGCLKGSATAIDAKYQKIFGTGLQLLGTWNIEAWLPEWFGAKGERGIIDTKDIQSALDAARNTGVKIVKLLGKTYYIDATLNVYPYTSLIGVDKTVSWLYATQIIPTSKVDAIKITANESDDSSTGVTIKNLIIRNGAGAYYSNTGVLLSKDTHKFGVSKLTMENVQILYFDYGIKADLYGRSPFSDCDFRNVECAHNNIGLCVEGHFDGSNGNKIWMNVNRFEFCRFSGNRIGGIYVHDVWMFMNNVFDQCTIEGNGNDYMLSLYKKGGVYGAKFANMYTPTTGGNVFQNCYFEGNIPRRKDNKAVVGEYKYGEYIYPEKFTDSKMTGNVILQQHDFSFSNCISSRNKSFVLLNDNSHVNITGTTVYDMEKTSETDKKRYFIEFNDAYVPSSVSTERNIFKILKENTLHYFHFIATPKGGDSKYKIQKGDNVDGGKVELDNMPVRQLLRK